MVGIFSRFSGGRIGSHRRSQSVMNFFVCVVLIDFEDNREVPVPNAEAEGTTVAVATATHGIEVAVEFKPVEHPIEPLNNDQPVKCPLSEPSILNDGRIWKERLSATVRRSTDLPVMMEGNPLESESNGRGPRSSRPNRLILPSLSAPEHNLINLLEECNAAGI
ncbi:hypothetical protein Syun_018103 [Stephania yunnanensis]|uniref:Cystic fibrosis transmembrane conductance regulator n=1 Tax=Stephania yunnanensis TaxID=152371 RepID=A0AAP0IRQ3_9MAGN